MGVLPVLRRNNGASQDEEEAAHPEDARAAGLERHGVQESESLKTYYVLLGVESDVPADEIKRAFRKEIARYHPDKVQHLGSEFQEIAAVRASELTEAYRVLMDTVARQKYDQGLQQRSAVADPSVRPAPPRGPVAATGRPSPPPEAPTAPRDGRFQQERATTNDFVRKAGIARLKDAVSAVARGSAVPVPGLDAAFDIEGKGGLFKKAEPPVRLLARFVPQVDAAAIEACWPLALTASRGKDTVCLLLLGTAGVAPAAELSVAIADRRRRSRGAGPIVIPVDVRDWQALFPSSVPASVRAIVQWLRDGEK